MFRHPDRFRCTLGTAVSAGIWRAHDAENVPPGTDESPFRAFINFVVSFVAFVESDRGSWLAGFRPCPRPRARSRSRRYCRACRNYRYCRWLVLHTVFIRPTFRAYPRPFAAAHSSVRRFVHTACRAPIDPAPPFAPIRVHSRLLTPPFAVLCTRHAVRLLTPPRLSRLSASIRGVLFPLFSAPLSARLPPATHLRTSASSAVTILSSASFRDFRDFRG